MPEQNEKIISKYQGDKNPDERYLKLGRKITDAMGHKISGVTSDDPEYWGLREVLTPEMCDIANKMKLRQHYTFEQLLEMNRDYEAIDLQKILDEMAYIGILEYDYGDNYDHTHELKDRPRIRRYRLPFYVPGSAELFNSSVDRIAKNPAVASFFERMTFIPLAGITQMVPPGGDGIGMHVIPVEKAIDAESKSIDLEHISYWLKKYEGHISAGICSCRASRAVLGDGCTDDFDDWCIQLGDMADYTVETGRAHYITKERALEILELAEKNGYVHQITNIDGENKIFDICNCNVKICNALRTSLLFNTPYLSRSSYTAKVEKEKCVACGKCVETCPAGAVKMGQKLCRKDGSEVKYPHAPLPDNNIWGPYAWDEDYRDTARMSNTYASGSAPCKAACPAHVPVQAYLRLAHEGKYREALAMIKTENPFPAVCGRVCNKRCESECTRGKIDAPVSIDAVKKFVADLDLNAEDRFVPEKTVQSTHGAFDEKIAIIGGGPAGLSAAYYLAQMGYKPTVFEKNPIPGGMLTYGIPSYKLEKDVIAAEIDIIKELGAEIKCGVEVGKDITLDKLREQGFKAFYLAVGASKGAKVGCPGDELPGVMTGIDFLREVNLGEKPDIGKSVAVIGGGNVAIDVARAAVRLGAKTTIVYRRDRDAMPAADDEVEEAIAEGVKFMFLASPVEITGEGKAETLKVEVMELKAGKPVGTGKFETLPVSAVISAIGQKIDLNGMDFATGAKGTVNVSMPSYQTSVADVFAGGDVVTGPKFAIDAIAAGKEGAISIHRYVHPGQSQVIGRDRRDYKAMNTATAGISVAGFDTAPRQKAADGSAKEAKKTFKDLRGTLTEEQMKIETSRCLGCGAAVVDESLCVGCGICTTKCKFDAIHLEKVTDYVGAPYFKALLGAAGNAPAAVAKLVTKKIARK
mgnify:CR=1 FL=1